MKKRIAILLLAVLILTACGKKNDTEPEYAGIYWRTWSEEIGGTVVDMNSYIVLNADSTGYWIAQDVGTLTWDKSQLKLAVGAAVDIALTQENGAVKLLVYEFQDENGKWIPMTYEKIKELPAEIGNMIHTVGVLP